MDCGRPEAEDEGVRRGKKKQAVGEFANGNHHLHERASCHGRLAGDFAGVSLPKNTSSDPPDLAMIRQQ
jgi:hypothetical protein